ncbi:MAG: ABC transporter substrate-binding protein [Oscillospiraceae bacterium]|jgi:polar amino acid transport system substrate-binding protein|nr:ABC transporter substrate-binding protein [Oscillospiraceae bacterium]
MKKAKKVICWLAVLACAIAGGIVFFRSTYETQEKTDVTAIKKAGVIKILTDPTFPPYEYVNNTGEIVGIDIDIANLIAEKLVVRSEIITADFPGLLPALAGGKGDMVIAAVSLTDQNKDVYPHSIPYANSCQRILVPAGCVGIGGLADLAGKKVGVPNGTTSSNFIDSKMHEEPFSDSPPTVVTYPSTTELVQALLSGRIDAALLDSLPAERAAEEDGIEVLPAMFGQEEYVFLYTKNASQGLVSDIDNIILEAEKNGTMDGFYKKHN